MILNSHIDSIIMRHDLMRNETHETIEQLEKVADDYTIEFFNWCMLSDTDIDMETSELLEIFKKDKGL